MIRSLPVLLLAVVVCFPGAVFARGKHKERHHPPNDGAEHADMLERWQNELELDAKQREAIEKILQKHEEESAKDRAAMKKLHEKMEALEKRLHRSRLETHEKVRDVLGFEQRERFDRMRMRGRFERKHRRIKIHKRFKEDPREEGLFIEEGPEGGWKERFMPPPEMWEGEDGPDRGRGRWHEEGEDGEDSQEFEFEWEEED